MKAQHTPGPWRIVDTKDEPSVRIYSPLDDSPGSLNNFAVAIGVQSNADARLIASAPDLLNALEDVCEIASRYCSHGGELGGRYNDERIEFARAAIAKARGQA